MAFCKFNTAKLRSYFRCQEDPNKMNANSGVSLLCSVDIVDYYLRIMKEASHPELLEAAAGAIQNLAAGHWKSSAEIRRAVRRANGLPILIELLETKDDRIVCAVVTALLHLSLESKTRKFIGNQKIECFKFYFLKFSICLQEKKSTDF